MATKPITPTSGGSITIPSSGVVYTLRTDGNVYRNGTRVSNSSGTEVLAYTPSPDRIHRRRASDHTWQFLSGTSTWSNESAPNVLPAAPTITLSAPTNTTLKVTVSDVVNIDGYHYQWRKHVTEPTGVSPNGTRITPGSGSITDNSGRVFTIRVSTATPPGVAYIGSAPMPDGANTSAMEWYNSKIYGQDGPSGFWYIFNFTSNSWARSQTAPPVITPTPTPTVTWTTI